jgi:hypothetical protein
MSEESTPVEEIEEAAKNENFNIIYADIAAEAHLKAQIPESDTIFWFVYEYQGVWDTQESQYVSDDSHIEFDRDNWGRTGENVEVPDETGRYRLSFRLDRCETDDKETIIDY